MKYTRVYKIFRFENGYGLNVMVINSINDLVAVNLNYIYPSLSSALSKIDLMSVVPDLDLIKSQQTES